MGFMDGFTSDGTVDMKHTEYYKHRYEVISRHTRAIGGTMNGVIEAVKTGTWKPDK